MPNDRPPRWRLAASSRFPRNARKQHLPKATIRRLNIDLTQARKSRYRRLPTEEREPLCGTHGEYKRIHYTYADALGLPPCAGCFDGVNLHK